MGCTSDAPSDRHTMSAMDATTHSPDANHGEARVGDGIRLHYVEAGEGPLVVLLHGFPEFWYGWRCQIPALAQAGLRVVAPDMRGYNLSDKPPGWRAYGIDLLTGDIADVIRDLGEERAYVVGHDWGAAVAYATAMRHPEVVRRLAILNAPHPARMLEGFRTLRQLRKSWYMFFFQLPVLPERALARDGFALAKRALRAGSAPGSFSDEDLGRYVDAWSQPGAADRDVQLLPGGLPPVPARTRGSDAADRGADAGDLGRARPGSRLRAGRTAPEPCA
jgi:epoxide hydrolase 4